MAIHTPVIQRPHVATAPNLVPLVIAVILGAVLAAAILLIQPTAKPAAESGIWMTEQRQGEINAGQSGPTTDVLLFRQGEINAAND